MRKRPFLLCYILLLTGVTGEGEGDSNDNKKGASDGVSRRGGGIVL